MQTPRRLILSVDNFDRINTFGVALGNYAGFSCSLHSGYKVEGDGILWIMQGCGILASSYTPAEIAERNRLNAESPVRHGDIVQVEDTLYRVRVLGNYSDCAILDKVPA